MDMENKKKITELLGRIRQIIGNTLSSNEEIKKILKELEGLGLKVNLNFIALVGPPPQGLAKLPFPFGFKDGFGFVPPGELEFKLTDEDKKFLKEIGIKFDDE